MLYKYKVDDDPFHIWRIVRHGGSHALLKNEIGNTREVLYKDFYINEHHKGENETMGNPTNCNKGTLLTCIEDCNDNLGFKTKLRVKSKSVAAILPLLKEKLQDANHFQITEKLKEETLCELVCWGILDVSFLGEEVPDGTSKVLEAIDDDTIQCEGDGIEFDDDSNIESADEESTSGEEGEEESASDEEDAPDLDALKAKLVKAEKKGKKKKIKKAKDALEVAEEYFKKAKANKSSKKSKDKKKKEKETPPEPSKADLEIEAVAVEIKELKDLEPPTKKKKLNKHNDKIAALTEKLAELMDANKDKPVRKKATKKADRKPGDVKLPEKGIIRSIADAMMTGKAVTKGKIYKHLVKAFPEKEAPESMKSTINVQLGGKQPFRIERERGVVVTVTGDIKTDKAKFQIEE